MVVVNIVINNTTDTDNFHVECNLLKREDAIDTEWLFAKAIESLVVETIRATTKSIKETHID